MLHWHNELGIIILQKQAGGGVPSYVMRRNINFSCNSDRMLFRRKLIIITGSFVYFTLFRRKQ